MVPFIKFSKHKHKRWLGEFQVEIRQICTLKGPQPRRTTFDNSLFISPFPLDLSFRGSSPKWTRTSSGDRLLAVFSTKIRCSKRCLPLIYCFLQQSSMDWQWWIWDGPRNGLKTFPIFTKSNFPTCYQHSRGRSEHLYKNIIGTRLVKFATNAIGPWFHWVYFQHQFQCLPTSPDVIFSKCLQCLPTSLDVLFSKCHWPLVSLSLLSTQISLFINVSRRPFK